ncbi:ABC transporter ATP-binding protein [Proteiniclasticum sp. QWL-01]|uniref:ABC transporter ATP-binding protein n=1 Tax=Proteiniclasticum sp. QWL-01 TaxID=3036945 RepID=UPI0022011711|nr:ABC transporter ATP-binding protein [Proteiniclasticum sp. QWL-01]UUM11384.1 ABC transporter ATP-binding protein [Clostridiaceae bacterium HFYG-1003]WFF72789.1 ABC transporter ATP-binding protein [Proteiniclasticum sp. QWL-01]
MNLLEIKGLHKAYDRKILNGIDLSLRRGEYVSIVGASGAGKSTLMNIVGLLEPFDSGDYIYDGKKISSEKERSVIRKNEIGFIFQSFHLLPTMTTRENILLPCMYSTKVPLDLDQIAERLAISHLFHQYPDQLSGGERQRVAIARCLITDPRLLLADEPTGNLDPENRDRVLEILREEHRKGKSVILITHDLQAAAQSERTCLLREGKLHEVS